ncbi:RHS repeat-associated protein [Pseudomonas sp. TE3786]
MSKKSLGHLGLWLCAGVLSVVSGLVQANPGISHRFGEPNYADGRMQLVVLDLKVQALGAPVRILRSWKNGQWVWNERWNDLEIVGAVDVGAPQGAADPVNADRPYAIIRDGQSYLRSSTTAIGQNISFNNLPNRTLIALQRGMAGYQWLDIQGNRNEYNAKGQMTGYLDHNGVRITFNRNAEGRITEIKDHNGENLITFGYTAGNVTSVRDYSGREVKYEYSGNQLNAVVDVLGKRWQYHYETYGLAGYTDPLQQRTTVLLSADDRVQEWRLPDGRVTKYSYSYDDTVGHYYLRKIDQAGLVTERWYDRLGQLVREQLNGETLFNRSYLLSDRSSDVSKVAEAYRITGKSLSVSKEISQRQGRSPSPYVAQMAEQDAQGNKTVTEYNRYGQIIRLQYADGSEIKKIYNPVNNQLSEEINERGIKTHHSYDDKGNMIELIEGASLPEEKRTSYRYNKLGQLDYFLSSVDDTEQVETENWQYRYDSKGNLTAITDPLGYKTQYTYDALGDVLSVTNAQNKTWKSTFDSAGNLLTMETPLGQETVYGYDDLGRLIRVKSADGGIETTDLNAAGNPISIVDAANIRTQFEYDISQRVSAVVDAFGSRTERNFDNRGRIEKRTDKNGNSTQYKYERGRLVGIDYPTFGEKYEYDSRERLSYETRTYNVNAAISSQSSQYQYLADGLVSAVIDAATNKDHKSYDGLGRLISTTNAAGGVTHYDYDRRDNLIQVTDASGRKTRFRYDSRDALIAEIKVGDVNTPTTERKYVYDEIGRLKQSFSPNGHASIYRYDDGNRLLRIEYFTSESAVEAGQTSSVARYSYNALNSLSSYEDESSKGVYTYDVLGRVRSITTTYKQALPTFSKTIHYTYDVNGRKASYTTPEQQIYGYSYTLNDRLAGVSIPGQGSITFQDFIWNMPQSIMFPGGSRYSVGYDGLQRYTERVLKDPAGNEILSSQYGYDAIGNLTNIKENNGLSTYAYNKLYRLTEAKYPGNDGRRDEAYAYDSVGNRLDEAQSKEELDVSRWQYDAHNQLIKHNGLGYRYDPNGNLIERGVLQADSSLIQSSEFDHWLYRYDARERLIEVHKNGQVLARYAYNPLGQRVSKILPLQGKITYYLYSEEGLVGEYDAEGELVQEYAYNPTAPWMSRPLFTRAKSTVPHDPTMQINFFGTSPMGTPEVAFLKSGEVTWQSKTQSFGETASTAGNLRNPLRFPGQYFDEDIGLNYNYFRDYDPRVGRYIQSDPIGLEGGFNRYAYVGGNPLRFSDPHGLVNPGEAACVAGPNPVCFVSVVVDIVVTTAAVAAVGAVATIPGDTPIDRPVRTAEEEAQAEEEYQAYKSFCDSPPPDDTGDICADMRNRIKWIERCIEMRQKWDERWLREADRDAHEKHIIKLKKDAEKLKKRYGNAWSCKDQPLDCD